MNLDRAARLAVAGLFGATLAVLPALAHAQVGSLAGKVVGQDGKPVADAEVTLTNAANSMTATAKTNNNGEWVRAGLMTGNPWNIRAKKGDLEGGLNGVRVPFNSVLELPPIVLAPNVDPATRARLEAEKAQEAAIAKMKVEVDAAVASGDVDLAITKYTEAATAIPNCAVCYVQIGNFQMKKERAAEAEKAYLEAIKIDDQNSEAYNALTNIYNAQRKFDEAAKMSAKFNAIAASSGGGGNAESLFNQGAIAFNQNKIAEAKPFLQKALALKPDLAEAHYLMGMVLINEGNVADAKKSLAEYLKLAPAGPNAATAKAILDTP